MNSNFLPDNVDESMGITAQQEIELLVLLDKNTGVNGLFEASTDDLMTIYTKATDLLSSDQVYYRSSTAKVVDGLMVLSVMLPELERAGYTVEIRSKDFRQYPCCVLARIIAPQPSGCEFAWEFEINPTE